MSHVLPPLRLTGAQILRDGEMQHRSVSIDQGRICHARLPQVDLSGYLVLPGIIDLHGVGFERHLSPHSAAPLLMQAGLASIDRDLASHGVTTAYLAQGWSWEGGLRSPDHAEALMAALDLYAPRALSDLRIHVRAETHLVDAGARLIAAIKRHKIGYVVFNDRLDEGHDMRLLAPANFALWARRVGKQPEELARNMDQARLRGREVPRHLCGLAEAFDDLGVLYGSHNDRDGETRERYCMIGARIAEFPATRQAARAARAMMCPVILGAPNVLRGTSQSGNVSAVDFVAEGLCDALASDCHTPALALAAWALVDRGLATLPKAWAMISTKPAEIMRMPDRGRLAPGMRADLVVVNSETRIIEATISAGKLSYLAGEAGRRFLSSPQIMRMAAE